jgi:biotin carboxyl carrier protein
MTTPSRQPAVRSALADESRQGEEPTLTVERSTGRRGLLVVDGRASLERIRAAGAGRLRVTEPGAAPRTIVFPGAPIRLADGRIRREVLVDGWRFVVVLESDRRATLRERARRSGEAGSAAGPTELRALIPGKVVRVDVAPGDDLAAGDHVLVLEAMKMQNEIRTPRSGRVARIAVAVGQSVELGDLLLLIE